MSIFKKIEVFVRDVFKTTLEIFLEALKLSPNAQGYVAGSISELLLKKHLESLNCEVSRIKEKWEGEKHHNHHGDFYFRHEGSDSWYVLESKGVKSNSEKWHMLYNRDKLAKFLFSHSDKIGWINQGEKIEPQIEAWLDENLPEFSRKYGDTLYPYEEIQQYQEPEKETRKSVAVARLKSRARDEINELIDERLDYLRSKVGVLETHFVSGTSRVGRRTQATPRKDEFNLAAIDIVLRYSDHRFLFANPKNLESSAKDPEHLQQNYIMGFVFNSDGAEELSLSDEWHDSFADACKTLTEADSVKESDMQVDSRNVVYPEWDELDT